MQKTFTKFMLFLMFLILCVSCDGTKSVTLKISDTSHDYSQVTIGLTATHDFILTNGYSKVVTLTNVTIAGPNPTDFVITVGGITPKDINGKETHTITVQFAPNNPAGQKNAVLQIVWEIDGKSKNLTATLTGEGIANPMFAVAPTTHDFGQVNISGDLSQDFTITNPGTSDMSVSNISLSGANASDFSITAGGAGGIITPGNNLIVRVSFGPAAVGAKTADLSITHDGVNEASPYVVTLSGEGVVAPEFSVTPTSKDFGLIDLNNTDTENFVVSNTGNGDLTLNNIALSGTHAAMFAITAGGTGGNVAPGASFTITVSFTPTTAGAKTATLSIGHNASNHNSPFTISLDGEGASPSSVLINECDMGSSDYVEIFNVSSRTVDLSGWTLSIWYLRSGRNTCCGTYTFPPGSSIGAGQVKVCAESSDPGDFQLGFNIMWSSSDGGEAILSNSNRQGVDYMFFNMARAEHIPSNLSWHGAAVPLYSNGNYYRNSRIDTDSAADWGSRSGSADKGRTNPGQ